MEDNIITVIQKIAESYEDIGMGDAGKKMNKGYNEAIDEGIEFLRPSQIMFGEVQG